MKRQKNVKHFTTVGVAQNIVPHTEQLHFYNKKIVDEFKLVLCGVTEDGQNMVYGPRWVAKKVDDDYVTYNPNHQMPEMPEHKIELLDLDPTYLEKLHMLSLRIA